jgi:hypothetical protein
MLFVLLAVEIGLAAHPRHLNHPTLAGGKPVAMPQEWLERWKAKSVPLVGGTSAAEGSQDLLLSHRTRSRLPWS